MSGVNCFYNATMRRNITANSLLAVSGLMGREIDVMEMEVCLGQFDSLKAKVENRNFVKVLVKFGDF
jgi:hypothetical protein